MIIQAPEAARMLCMLLFISRCSYFVYEQRDATQVEDLLNRLAQENSSNQSGAHLTSCPEVACMEPIELLVLLNHALPVSRVFYIDYDTDVYSVAPGVSDYLERNSLARVTLVKVAQHVSCSRIGDQTDRLAQLLRFRERVTFVHLCNRLAPVPGRDLDDFSQLALVWEFQASNIYSTLELPTSLLTCNLLDVTSNQDPSRSNASLSALYREHANQTTARELLARSTAVCPSVCSLEDAYRLPALPFCRPSGELSDGATFLLASLVVACFCQLTILIYAVDNAKPLFASSEV